jgi:hypothetical protein
LYFLNSFAQKTKYFKILQEVKSNFLACICQFPFESLTGIPKKFKIEATLLLSCKLLTVPAAGIFIICAQTTLIVHSNHARTADRANTLGYTHAVFLPATLVSLYQKYNFPSVACISSFLLHVLNGG